MRLQLNTSWITLAAISALAIAPSSLAQTGSDAGDTIFVTGTAVPVAADKVGQTITVISGQVIEDQGYTYVPDVLRQVPSLAVSQPGAPGALTQVRVRGAEANHTLVLLDGIDISSPDQGETDFSTLLSGDIARIEVLRGPQSGLYGSNALAGVVNLISRREVNGHYLGASVEAGSFDTVELAANGGLGDADSYAGISASWLTSSGYDVSPDQTANSVPAVGGAKAGDKEGNTAASLNLRGGTALSETLRINGVARYFKSTAELDGQAFGFPIAGRTYDDASETEHEQTMIGGAAAFDPFAGAWETTLSASYVDENRINRITNFPFLSGPPAPTQAELLAIPLEPSGVDSTRAKVGILSTLRFGDATIAHVLSGFVENERETFEDAFTGRDESRTLNAFGLQYRAEIAKALNLYATVRRDQNDDFEDADTYSLAASWAIPGTGARLHTSYGTGVTNPTFIEQFGFDPGTFIGNATLAPEEAVGWDFGIEQTVIADRLVVDLTYFESALDNEIFTDFLLPDFIATPLNSSTESNRNGWELYVTANPIEDVSLIASWTELDASEPNGIEIRRPEQQGSLDASWRISGGPVKLNLGVTYNGDMVDTDFGTFLRTRVAPYTLVRFGASWKFSDQIELYGRVENLLDEDHQEVIGYNAAPQAAYIGIRFRDEASK
jgi:vitamin B12 transporter